MIRLAHGLLLVPFVNVALSTGCSEDVGGGDGGGGSGATTTGSGGNGAGGMIDISDEGTPLAVDVDAQTPVYVDLDEPAVVEPDDPAKDSTWELSFVGWDLFTNSGVSGSADGGAFGPLAAPTFLLDEEPEYPFITTDKTGGAFLGWYAYDGSTHALWSRYHIYGVDTGTGRFKVQILGYYGEVQGAPVTALYTLRYAEVTAGGVGPSQIIENLDGTAGGLGGSADAPSGCVSFATGQQLALSPAETMSSTEWHLCFRRDVISVNGGLGGPGEVTATDITAASLDEVEPLEEVMAYTSSSKLAPFEAADDTTLSDPGLVYRGDRIVSAFDGRWYGTSTDPWSPAVATWVVAGADGAARFLLAFESFEGATDETPTRVNLRVKRVD